MASLADVLAYSHELAKKYTSLDTPQMTLGETAADIGMGFAPGLGTAQAARDFERARRGNDYWGMGLSAAGMVPVVGGVVKAGKAAAKSSKLAKALEAAAPEVKAVVNPILASGVGTVPKELFDKRIKGIGNLPESDLYDSAGNLSGDMQKNVWKLNDGTYLAVQRPAWLSKDKSMYVHADNVGDAISGLISKSLKSEKAVSAAAQKKYENSVQGLLDNEFGEGAFSFAKSERSKSQYITHNATGEKIRISDHALPLAYESADLDIPIELSDKEIFERIKKHIRPDDEVSK